MMPEVVIMIIIAIIAVGMFVLGLSITLIRKGRHIHGDVGSNPEMKKRGLVCTSKQFREEEAAFKGGKKQSPAGCSETVDCHCDLDCETKSAGKKASL